MKVTFRTHSISPGDHRSSRGSGPAAPDEVLATTGLGGSARQMSASVLHPSSGRPDCVAEEAAHANRSAGQGRPAVQSHPATHLLTGKFTGNLAVSGCTARFFASNLVVNSDGYRPNHLLNRTGDFSHGTGRF